MRATGLSHPALSSSQPQVGGVVYTWRGGAISIIGSTVTSCSAVLVRRVELAASQQRRTAAGREMERGHGCLTPLSPSQPQEGGVVLASNSESLSIAGVDFIDNGAGRSGSVLYLDKLRQRTSISDASFTGNTAGDDNDGGTKKNCSCYEKGSYPLRRH